MGSTLRATTGRFFDVLFLFMRSFLRRGATVSRGVGLINFPPKRTTSGFAASVVRVGHISGVHRGQVPPPLVVLATRLANLHVVVVIAAVSGSVAFRTQPNNRFERYGRQRAALRGFVLVAHVSCPFAVRPSTVGFDL